MLLLHLHVSGVVRFYLRHHAQQSSTLCTVTCNPVVIVYISTSALVIVPHEGRKVKEVYVTSQISNLLPGFVFHLCASMTLRYLLKFISSSRKEKLK